MENEEKWRAVVEFEGLYEVSSIGRVRSLDRVVSSGRMFPGRILRQRRDSRGYMHVNLWRDRRMTTMRVHRLVLIAFAGAPEGPVEVQRVRRPDLPVGWGRRRRRARTGPEGPLVTLIVAATILAALLSIITVALTVLIVNENRRPRGRTEEV